MQKPTIFYTNNPEIYQLFSEKHINVKSTFTNLLLEAELLQSPNIIDVPSKKD